MSRMLRHQTLPALPHPHEAPRAYPPFAIDAGRVCPAALDLNDRALAALLK
jgi:hypothetical protein